MSKGSHLKKHGHRKDKRVAAMRKDEYRRHAESGIGYPSSRHAPHTSHSRKQVGYLW